MTFKPLLSDPVNFKHLDFSNVWVSPKYDGIRVLVRDGVVVSRKLKPIPNLHVQNLFGGRPELEGYDGEIIVGEPNDPNVYLNTYSGVMSKDGEPDAMFYAFDHFTNPLEEYHVRYSRVYPHKGVVKVPQHPVESEADARSMLEFFLEKGYEGMMLRTFWGPLSHYKYGRSTARECTLLKMKPLEDFDAVVVGFEEQMFNGNVATVDALGHTKRSSHAVNMSGKGTLGKILARTMDGVEFKVGIFKGLKAADTQEIWDNQEKYRGRPFKAQKLSYGEKDKPRHPRWNGWRDPIDMAA